MLNIFKLHISSRWFRKAEVKHQTKLQEEIPAWGKIDEEDILDRVNKKRKGIYLSLSFVASSLAVGVGCAELVNNYYQLSAIEIRWLRLFSIGVVAWAVLSRLGYESETFKGLTLLEVTSLRSFKVFYLLAVTLAALCLFLEPVALSAKC